MTHEEVNTFEALLREAERKVEGAAQAMCDVPQTDEINVLWSCLNQAIALIGDCIHRSYLLRPNNYK